MEEQRQIIQHLQKENAALRESRRSKDEAISRLLRDLKAAEEARGEVSPMKAFLVSFLTSFGSLSKDAHIQHMSQPVASIMQLSRACRVHCD